MPILRYENLTHSELAALPRDKTVVLLSVGPLEEHGPHLPLGVDAFLAEFFAQKMAEKLGATRSELNFLLFPTIFAGCDTLNYMGTIEVRPTVLHALLYDCCKYLAKHGFRTMIAVAAHGGPRHMVVLEEIAAKMRWRHRVRMISASSRILLEFLQGNFVEKIAKQLEKNGDSLKEEERQALKAGDYHGGLIETSIMMVAKPDLVKPLYKELKPAIVDKYWKITRNSGRKVGEGLGHLGTPALARPQIGTAVVEVALNDVLPMIQRFIDGENVYKHFRSKLYYIPIFRTHFKVFAMMMFYAMGLWIAMTLFYHYGLETFK